MASTKCDVLICPKYGQTKVLYKHKGEHICLKCGGFMFVHTIIATVAKAEDKINGTV